MALLVREEQLASVAPPVKKKEASEEDKEKSITVTDAESPASASKSPQGSTFTASDSNSKSGATESDRRNSDKVFETCDQFCPIGEPVTNAKETSTETKFMDLHSIHPVIQSFLIGSVSGTCSTVLFQPLDLLKTRLQGGNNGGGGLRPNLAATTSGGNLGMVSLASQILRQEHFSSLWKGMTPSLTRCVPGVGLYFATIHSLKTTFNIDGEPTAIQSLLLGATGRSFSGVLMIPFTVIKTRFESRVYHYSGIREALFSIYKGEGIRGLTCGLLPTLLRDAPFSGLYLLFYTSAKKATPKEWMDSQTVGPSVRFSCGIAAGFAASIVTQPFDVIKTKMQLYPEKFSSFKDVVPYVYNRYGMQGYFKGLMPRMIRRTLVAAMSWTLYEQLIKSIGLK